MKTKLKQTNGITLIALIITIIILLILAMVTIRILMNQGIIKHAQNATEAYNEAQTNETEYLTYAEGEMDKYAGVTGGGSSGKTTGNWVDNGDGTISDGKVTAQIGDYINYDCYTGVDGSKLYYKSLRANNGYGDQEFEITSNPKWKILGISDNGNILITTTDTIQTKASKAFYLKDKAGYVNGPDELNAISEIFGHGTHATGARSITVEDVNKITGYTPSNSTTYTYTKNAEDGKIYRNDATSSSYSTYWYYENEDPKGEWKRLASGETSPEIAITYYSYSIATSNVVQKMLCYKSDGSTNASYWLASRCVLCYKDSVEFDVRRVKSGGVSGGILYVSRGISGSDNYGVRPVVSLASDVEIEYDSTNSIWKIK